MMPASALVTDYAELKSMSPEEIRHYCWVPMLRNEKIVTRAGTGRAETKPMADTPIEYLYEVGDINDPRLRVLFKTSYKPKGKDNSH